MRWGRGGAAELGSAALLCAAIALGLWNFNAPAGGAPLGPDSQERAALTLIHPESTDRDWGLVSLHTVIEHGALEPEVTGAAEHVWADFLRIATPEFVERHVATLRLADAPRSDLIASVERDPASPDRWRLTVNLGTQASPFEMRRTLLHEFAHMISLDPGQFSTVIGACPTTLIQEGCLLATSSLHRFASLFWTGAADGDSVGSDFVTAYASTNVVEDFAETFVEFVLRDRPRPEPQRSVAKIRSLWFEPSLTAIRERLRSTLGDELPI